MARTAVALERHRRLRKTHPATLTELVPEGGFVLYSIGLDGRDDEAQVIDDRRDLFDPQVHGRGDWVWPLVRVHL